MRILEFLLSNWYIPVLFFVFLSSLFKNKWVPEDKKNGHEGGMPTFGGRQTQGNKPQSIPVQPPTLMEHGGINDREQARMISSEDDSYVDQDRSSLIAASSDDVMVSSEIKSVTTPWNDTKAATVRRTKNQQHQQPASNHLVQGIIWSEVLGPPRARRPHRTRRF